jgi:cation-transporting ATPase I
VKGVDRLENADLAHRVEDDLTRLPGVHWAEVNAILGRVVVAFDDRQVGVDDLIEVIEGAEEAYGVAAERFPDDRPEHPADVQALQRQMYAIGAEIAGLGLGLAGRAIRANPLLSEVASVVSLVDATPSVRRRLESRFGHAATDLSLAVGNAVAQGLAQGPFGLLVNIAHRSLRLNEMRARREVWDRREPELSGQCEGDPLPALSGTQRPASLPAGPVESYADRAAQAALAATAATGMLTRDVRAMVAATVTATPKAVRLGREGFTAWLGRHLAHSGVLAMDAGALRRLDRIDTVVLDVEVLVIGRTVLGAVWVPPDRQRDVDQVRLNRASPARHRRPGLHRPAGRMAARARAAPIGRRGGRSRLPPAGAGPPCAGLAARANPGRARRYRA